MPSIDHAAVAEALPFSAKTFVSRLLRSDGLKAGCQLELLTDSALIRGMPAETNGLSDRWHHAREQISAQRHDPEHRVPSIEGGGILELEAVTVEPLAGNGRTIAFDNLVVFTEDLIGIRLCPTETASP